MPEGKYVRIKKEKGEVELGKTAFSKKWNDSNKSIYYKEAYP